MASADNEEQLAGVLAHDIAHVALRHGTNQASKANLIQLPAMLGGALAGRGGSLMGQLAQLGIGLGANSVLLKFSRNAERDADLLGTRIMARVGYNPIEMARFFEKLEGEGGGRGLQFFSDHPNPGNRRKAVEQEIRYLPQRAYTTGDPQGLTRAKKLVAGLPEPKPKPKQPAVAEVKTSGKFREHRAGSYTLSYPDNWEVLGDQKSPGVTIAPKEGIVQSESGTAIGVGAVTGFHTPAGGRNGLQRDTEDLVKSLASSNPGMKAQGSRQMRVDGKPALEVTLHSQSPYAGEVEIDTLVTVDRPEGVFYVVLIAPKSALQKMQGTFAEMIRSIRFPQ
jgi:hypothetical protein